MADEPQTQTAEPSVSIHDPAFGNLEEAFDNAFPSTIEKEPETPPEPVKPPEAAPPPPEPTKPLPEATKAPESDLPDFLTGKVEEKKPEPPREPEVDLESVGLKELRAHYKTLKQTARTERETLQKALEEAKKTPVQQTPPEIEATIRDLEAKNKELSEALEQGYVENHPAIRQKYVEGKKTLVEKAHRLLNAAKIDPKLWDRAMSMPLENRIEAMEEIYLGAPTFVQKSLTDISDQIEGLDVEHEAILADRKGATEKLRQQDMIRQREAIQQHEKSTLQILDLAKTDLLDRVGLEVLKKSDNPGHAKWNEGVDRRLADAKKLMLEITDEPTMARASILAASALDYRHLYHLFRDRAIEAENKLKSYDSAEPTTDTKGEKAPETNDNLSFAEAVARDFPRR